MKNRKLYFFSGLILAMTLAGCGTFDVSDIQSIAVEETEIEETRTEETKVEESVTNESASAEDELPEISQLTFADLAEYQFEFASGAGAWSESFAIERDGYFTGMFHDSDMGDTGEGYEDGTLYISSYSGHFTDLIKINDYTYQMRLADISYKMQAGTEEISENIRYIYTESYCLSGTDTFTIYLPQTPVKELSEDICIWLGVDNQSGGVLDMPAIADESNGYGIYSYDRTDALKEAEATFTLYKESYDYYAAMLSEADTTAEMVEYSGRMYKLSDDCLNEIWHLIRYNVEEDKFEEILAEQRLWIAEKEASAMETSAEYEGGSFAEVSYNDTLANLTIKRCEELIEYLR